MSCSQDDHGINVTMKLKYKLMEMLRKKKVDFGGLMKEIQHGREQPIGWFGTVRIGSI